MFQNVTTWGMHVYHEVFSHNFYIISKSIWRLPVLSGKDRTAPLHLYVLLFTTSNAGQNTHNKHSKGSIGRKKSVDCLGMVGLEKQHGSATFPGRSVASYIFQTGHCRNLHTRRTNRQRQSRHQQNLSGPSKEEKLLEKFYSSHTSV